MIEIIQQANPAKARAPPESGEIAERFSSPHAMAKRM